MNKNQSIDKSWANTNRRIDQIEQISFSYWQVIMITSKIIVVQIVPMLQERFQWIPIDQVTRQIMLYWKRNLSEQEYQNLKSWL